MAIEAAPDNSVDEIVNQIVAEVAWGRRGRPHTQKKAWTYFEKGRPCIKGASLDKINLAYSIYEAYGANWRSKVKLIADKA